MSTTKSVGTKIKKALERQATSTDKISAARKKILAKRKALARNVVPLPLTWTRRSTEYRGPSGKDAAIFGQAPDITTKTGLRMHLSYQGWDSVEALDHVLSGSAHRFRAEHWLEDVEARDSARDSNPEDLIKLFRDSGLAVKTAADQRKWPRAIQLWKEYTTNPWWLSSSAAGARIVILVSRNAALTERASAAFLVDLWQRLGVGPEDRMPKFRRSAVASMRTPDALERLASASQSLDVLVLHGGSHESALASAETLIALSGVRAVFRHGLLVYEMVVDSDDQEYKALKALRKQGFGSGTSIVLGLATKKQEQK